MKMQVLQRACASVLLFGAHCATAADVEPVAAAPRYVPSSLVAGQLSISGSRTMSELAAIWTDGIRAYHPGLETVLDFQGSGTALEGLAGGEDAIGLLSRELTPEDQEQFSKQYPNSRLLGVTVGYDALCVIVHPANPLEAVTFPQLKRLFEASADNGETVWGSVGLEDEWGEMPVRRIVPGPQSGTRVQFQKLVVGESSEFGPCTELDWHTEIADAVAQDRQAIGIVRLGSSSDANVRTLRVARDEDSIPRMPSFDDVSSGEYPLLRPLTLLVVVPGDAAFESGVAAEFVRYALSEPGQEDVVKGGFHPLDRSELLEQLDRLEWNQQK